MTNILVIAGITAAVTAAVIYIIREKKQGHCVGCPYAKGCGGNCRSGK